jgi:N-acetyltransferase
MKILTFLFLRMDIKIEKLRGRHVYLELLQSDHRELIRPLANDERIWEYTRGIVVEENYDANFDIYFSLALDNKSTQQAFVIKRTGNDEIIGMTRFLNYNERDKTVEIGYTWYIPSVWKKVHNRECKLLLLQYAFEVMHLNRVEFKVAHQNVRSQKAVEKIGGMKEGVLRKHSYRNDGTIRDTVIFSIIDDEWPWKKEKLLQLITESEND